MTWRDDGYVEALQQETIILAKRVMAARSRLLLSTCFDASPTLQDHPGFGEAVAGAAEADGLEDLSVIEEEEEDGAGGDAASASGETCWGGAPRIKGLSEMESRSYWAALRRTQEDAGGGDGGARGAEPEADRAETRKRPDKGETSDSDRGQGLEAVGRSDRIESVVKISEGFNVEDWRRLKESFIL
ncbi:uncharacterized protein LOC119580802 isoform X2 [Penaeus monodon]|nr:uncharacterized protein LOC119580802 isoform X2 [Penaeus monodon]